MLEVKKAIHLTSDKFKAEDIHYEMKVIAKSGATETPTLRSLADGIETALRKILNSAIHYCRTAPDNRDVRNVASLAISQDDIRGGLQSGFYHLDQSEALLKRLFYRVTKFLSSNQDFSINKTFKVNVKILGRQHSEVTANNLFTAASRPVGAFPVTINGNWCYKPPEPISQFDNRCLQVAVLVGQMRELEFDNFNRTLCSHKYRNPQKKTGQSCNRSHADK